MAATGETASTKSGINDSSQGKPHKREQRHPSVRAALITGSCTLAGAAITAAVALVLNLWPTAGSASTHKPQPSEKISITSPQQGASVGLLTSVTGTANHLRPNQMIWVLIEPYTKNRTATGVFYPAIGPCPLRHGNWYCRIQVGSMHATGREFALWAVIVTSTQGYKNAHLEVLPEGSKRYFTSSPGSGLPRTIVVKQVRRIVTRL
jgi:hypothetical protein